MWFITGVDVNRYEFWLRLLMVKGCRSKKLRRLHVKAELTDYQIEQLLHLVELNVEQKTDFYQTNDDYLKSALNWLSCSGNHLITYDDPDYPTLLRHIKDAPLALFVRGNVSHLSLNQIAMVGSRNFSHYGKQWGRYFASELAINGFAITSGLALGIDSICHKAVIDEKGVTIAVLGSGLDSITPRRHISLAEEILNNNGTLVSEFFPLEPAKPEYFPKRNRIISGLCKGVLIVEAALKSGSLITARCALEQGREVFALPGPLGNNGYQGTHCLIQQGANLITRPTDIIEYLNSTLNWLDEDAPSDLDSDDNISIQVQEVLPFSELLSNVGDEVTPVDIIAERMSLSTAEISLQLLELELSGYVASIQGGYIRIRKMNNK